MTFARPLIQLMSKSPKHHLGFTLEITLAALKPDLAGLHLGQLLLASCFWQD